MSEYVDSRDLLDEYQSGFRSGYSTQTALLKLTDDIRWARDNKMVTAMLLFDFSKAFDSVCHVTLVKKLSKLGFSFAAIKWIASYLSDRTQAVSSGFGTKSTFLSTNKGVPQGSILGPILFALYVGDVAYGLGAGIKYVMYADDLQIYLHCTFNELNDALQRLGLAAERVTSWADDNCLRLNVTKTQAIVFGSAPYINRSRLDKPIVRIHYTLLQLEESVRCLGVILDDKLNWKEQVRSIGRRANTLIYRLNYFRRCTNIALRQHLIQALLFPIVDYYSLVFADLSVELSIRLERIVNMGIRYIYVVRRSEPISPFRRGLGWLKVAGRRNYFKACLLFKILKTGKPAYLARMFSAYVSHRPVRGVEPKRLVVPISHHISMDKSFHISSAILWNSLPSVITDTQSLISFKTRVFNYLFDKEEGESTLVSHL